MRCPPLAGESWTRPYLTYPSALSPLFVSSLSFLSRPSGNGSALAPKGETTPAKQSGQKKKPPKKRP